MGEYRHSGSGRVRAGWSASRTSGDSRTTDPGGGGRAALAARNRPSWVAPVAHSSGWSPSVQGFPPLGSHPQMVSTEERARGNRKTHDRAQPVVGQMDRVVQDATSEMGGSLPSLFSPVSGARRAGRKMRPAGGNNRPQKKSNHSLVVTGIDVVSEGETNVAEKLNGCSGDPAGLRRCQDAHLPGGELTSHSASEHSSRAERTNEKKGYRNSVPPRDVTGEAFEWDNAAVPTTVPADSAGILFPAVAGMECPAIAEDLSLAVDVGGLPPAVHIYNRSGLLPGRVR